MTQNNETPCPFTEEQLQWLKDNLKVESKKYYDWNMCDTYVDNIFSLGGQEISKTTFSLRWKGA